MWEDFRLDVCCLTILIYILLKCLRVRQAHATPDFPDFNMNVYGVKGERLWGVKWTFMGLKVNVYGENMNVYGESRIVGVWDGKSRWGNLASGDAC